ncbi:hypothetical protein PRNP1_006560 [Phytophthora ramorum]
MTDYVPCATPPSKGFFSRINPLTIFDDVDTLTPSEFLRDFYTRRGLQDKLEDVDALVQAYGHQMHLLYAELDKKCRQNQFDQSSSQGEFNEDFASTIGVEFLTHAIKVDNADVKAQIWDTAGQERFHAMMSTYYRKAAGALLVFDVGNRTSLLDVERWLDQLLNVAEPGLHATLVGNKCDLPADKRAVSSEEVRQFAAAHHMAYIETSAKTGLNVEEAFRDLVVAIHRARLDDFQESSLATIEINAKTTSSSSLFDCKFF